MSRQKFVPSQTKKEAAGRLDSAPARDSAALIVPIATITVSPNDRSDLPKIEELAASIREHGVLQALAVIRVLDGFELVAGRRRLAAAKVAGLDAVPVRVLDVQGDGVAVVRLIENIQREQLSGIDEVNAVAKLLSIFGSQKVLAETIGKSQTYVSRCIKASHLPPNLTCAGASLTKSALLELADAADPKAALAAASDGKKSSIREARAEAETGRPSRQSSGPIAGGRYADPVKFRETGTGWTLRIAWDPIRAPVGTKESLIKTLETLLAKLKA